MNLKIISFIAWRYLCGTQEQSSLRTMVWVCGFGIFIGTFALGLTTSVMNGFEIETHKKLQGIYPDIILQTSNGNNLESKALIDYLRTTCPDEIVGLSDYSTQHILVQKKDTESPTVFGLLKSVNPATESTISPLQEKLQINLLQNAHSTNKLRTLQEVLISNHVLLGKEIAHTLNVVPGDAITICYNQSPQENLDESTLNKTTCIVEEILNTGIADYDATLVICCHDLITDLLEQPYKNQIGIKLNPLLSESKKNMFLEKLKLLPDLTVYAWHDQYPAIISALKLEKYVMYILLTLFILIASINNISLLFMFITYKKTDIALLRSLAMPTSSLMMIFLLFNTIITACAAFTGLSLAYALATFLEWYPCIQLPDAYYVTYLPISIHVSALVIIFLGSVLLSICTALLPILSIRSMSVTHVFRFEQ